MYIKVKRFTITELTYCSEEIKTFKEARSILKDTFESKKDNEAVSMTIYDESFMLGSDNITTKEQFEKVYNFLGILKDID